MILNRTWLFVGVVALQLGIVLYSPAKHALIRSQGREISLQMAPVDPYSFMTGYSMDLSYVVSTPSNFPVNEAGTEGEVIAVLTVDKDNVGRPKALLRQMPRLAENEVALRGSFRRWGRIEYGIEKFYMPETQREEISAEANRAWGAPSGQAQRPSPPVSKMRVDVRIAPDGEASLVRMHVNGHVYE